MGRRYSSSGNQAALANTTIIGLTSAATVRPKIYDLIVSCGASPADLATIFHLERFTAAGTSTAFTPIALDPADPAALASAGYNHTAEPTYTADAVLMKFSLNQRATFRWAAMPGSEIVLPNTAANGVGLQIQATGGTAVHEATILHEE
jgi:hypothetical protein